MSKEKARQAIKSAAITATAALKGFHKDYNKHMNEIEDIMHQGEACSEYHRYAIESMITQLRTVRDCIRDQEYHEVTLRLGDD